MRMALASSIFVLIFSFRYSSYANGWATALACTLEEGGELKGKGTEGKGGGRSEVERGGKGKRGGVMRASLWVKKRNKKRAD